MNNHILGVQQYDKNKKPICAICGKSYDRLLTHVRQAHKMPSDVYRKRFGFCRSFSFISQQSKEKAKSRLLENYDLVVTENLINKGKKTRVKKGERRFDHTMTPQRLLIIAENRSKQDLSKPKAYCIDCGIVVSTRKTKLCLRCYRLRMIERNKAK